MEIKALNQGSFQIKGKRATLLISPISSDKAKADAIFLTNNTDGLEIRGKMGARLVSAGPGEYEIGGATIEGKRLDDALSFRIILDGVSLLYLTKVPNDSEQLEQLGPVDILMLGEYKETIYELEPKIIVPFSDEVARKLGKLATSERKLIVTKEKLPQDLKVVGLYG